MLTTTHLFGILDAIGGEDDFPLDENPVFKSGP